MKANKSDDKLVPITSRLLNDGAIVELMYKPNDSKTILAVYREGAISFKDSIDIDNGDKLIPISPSNNLLKHRAVLLPEHPEPYVSTEALLEDIRTYLYRYIDLSDAFLHIASCYILLTWVYDAFNELPYLRLRGDYGSGKTRALLVIGSICYKAFFASGASTVSPIFHTLNTFQGTLIFDEADFRFSDEKAEIIKIFNNGNVRGFPVLRTAITQKREFDPRAFVVYGPKIVAMRRSFEDRALESRFITEDMGQRKLRKDIPINLPDTQQGEARDLRNMLLMYRFKTLDRVSINANLVDTGLSPRLNQILVPLLSIIEDDSIKKDVREAALVLEDDLRAEMSSSPEGQLLEVLVDLMGEATRPIILLSDIVDRFMNRFGHDYERPITNRYVGHLIRTRLRIHSYKSHGVYVIPKSEKPKIDALCARYGIQQISGELGLEPIEPEG